MGALDATTWWPKSQAHEAVSFSCQRPLAHRSSYLLTFYTVFLDWRQERFRRLADIVDEVMIPKPKHELDQADG